MKRGVSLALDQESEKRVAFSDLLAHLVAVEIMSKDQVALGFTRALEAVPDLSLDIPNAPELISALIRSARSSGLLPGDFPEAAQSRLAA